MSKSYTSEEIIAEEYLHILSRRANALADLNVDATRKETSDHNILAKWAEGRPNEHLEKDDRPDEKHLIGVALSGGGIRSATFCLGALQSLAELGLLRFCDYLSAVSGGGYIASWLAAWIKREGELKNVEIQLRRSRVSQAQAKRGFIEHKTDVAVGVVRESEPEPLAHIREFSFFLSPRWGFLSLDSWSLVAVYIRNLFANLMALIPAMLAVLLLIRSIGHVHLTLPLGPLSWIPLFVAAICGFAGLLLFANGLRLLERKEDKAKAGPEFSKQLFYGTLVLTCFASVTAAWCCQTDWSVFVAGFGVSISLVNLGCITVALFALTQFVISFICRSFTHAFISTVSTAFAAFLVMVLLFGLQQLSIPPSAVPLLGPPSVLFAVVIGNMTGMALLGWVANEEEREWRSRLNAWLMIVAAAWSLFAGLAFYSGLLLSLLGSWLVIAVASWATIGATGVRFAFSAVATDQGKSTRFKLAVASVVPYVLVLGLLILLSGLAAWLDSSDWENQGIPGTPSWPTLGGTLVVCLLVSWSFSLRVSANDFSLNAMYANRLTRCFLGASRRKREDYQLGTPAHCSGSEWNPDPVTGFDFNDDLPLSSLRIGPPSISTDKGYWGPFLLFNTALNVQASDRLASQERKAESFLLSPLFCGAHSLGYRETSEYAAGNDGAHPLSVGRAIAISGAAVNPAMGFYGSPAISALLAVFNIRLAWWLPNPCSTDVNRGSEPWRAEGPRGLLRWLAKELFSQTDDKSPFLNVSDGGHFDNLGLYELVRRRCRLIISIDAGADPDNQAKELGELIRRCRADFGIDIEIDTTALTPNQDSKLSATHCVVGTIRYDRLDPIQPVGTLLYIKPGLTGDESHDIRQFARQFPHFPHQSTVNQFYTQSQFESYRALGHHCVQSALEEVASSLSENGFLGSIEQVETKTLPKLLREVTDKHYNALENLVYSVRSQWLPDSSGVKRLGSPVTERADQHQPVSQELTSISNNIIEEISNPLLVCRSHAEQLESIQPLSEVRATLRALEQVFFQQQQGSPLQLDNFGWMNLFRRLSAAGPLRQHWPLLHFEYSREFVRFCKRELSLSVEHKFESVNLLDEMLWNGLLNEFYATWPSERKCRRGLDSLIADAYSYRRDDSKSDSQTKALWQVRVHLSNKDSETENGPGDGIVAGLIGLRPLRRARKLRESEFLWLRRELKARYPKCKSIPANRLTSISDKNLERLATMQHGPASSELDSRTGYELVVWVRPGFRHRKVGETLLQGFFDLLDQQNSPLLRQISRGGNLRLVVYYPRTGWQSSRERFRAIKRHWLTFFSFYGFRRPGKSWPFADKDEVLVYHGSPEPTGDAQSIGNSRDGAEMPPETLFECPHFRPIV